MKIEVKIVPEPDDKENAARQSVSVELHERRNDTFNVQQVDNVNQGDGQVFTVPVGGRLVINTPQTHEELVYDRDQGAAIRRSHQSNDSATVADRPKPTPPPQRTAPSSLAGASSQVTDGTVNNATEGAGKPSANPTTAANTNPTPTGNTQPASNVPGVTTPAKPGNTAPLQGSPNAPKQTVDTSAHGKDK